MQPYQLLGLRECFLAIALLFLINIGLASLLVYRDVRLSGTIESLMFQVELDRAVCDDRFRNVTESLSQLLQAQSRKDNEIVNLNNKIMECMVEVRTMNSYIEELQEEGRSSKRTIGNLRSKLHDKQNETYILRYQQKELQQKCDDQEKEHVEKIQSCQADVKSKYDEVQGLEEKIRVSQEEIQSCQADVQSKYDEVQDLKEKIHVSKEKHEEELRVEQRHKQDELGKKEKELSNLHQHIQDNEKTIQTLSRERDDEKVARKHERAMCDRKIEDLKSTCEKSRFGWLSFGAGAVVGATGGCLVCSAGTMSFK